MLHNTIEEKKFVRCYTLLTQEDESVAALERQISCNKQVHMFRINLPFERLSKHFVFIFVIDGAESKNPRCSKLIRRPPHCSVPHKRVMILAHKMAEINCWRQVLLCVLMALEICLRQSTV